MYNYIVMLIYTDEIYNTPTELSTLTTFPHPQSDHYSLLHIMRSIAKCHIHARSHLYIKKV